MNTFILRNESNQNVAPLTNRGGYNSSPDDSCDTVSPDFKEDQNGEAYAVTVKGVLALMEHLAVPTTH